MKRLAFAAVAVLGLAAGCASEDATGVAASAGPSSPRLAAGDELGLQLQAHDRAIKSAGVDERSLNGER